MFDDKVIKTPDRHPSNISTSELLSRIESGESLQTEFKRLVHSSEKIAKSMVAFANTSGGIILIGVDDDKRIVGVESEKEIEAVIEDAANFHTEPTVRYQFDVIDFRGRDLVMITVPESNHKPHYHLGESRDPKTFKKFKERKVYLRSGSQSIVATKDQVMLLEPYHKPLKISYGEDEKILFKYLDTYQRITLAQYSKLVNASSQHASQILIALVKAGVIMIHTEGKLSYYTHPLKVS
ncbi:MAG: ATP-binding protein [Chloroherpetonaceae bacterium]|nr:ATP-binding protein [Chloroherpetonaceae bacterium]